MKRTTAVLSILAIGGAAFAQTGADEPMAKDVSLTLVGPTWIVEDLGGQSVIEDAQASLVFHEDSSLSGSGSCNRLRAQYTEEDGTLSVTPIATTMMLCADAVMDQEAQLLSMLEAVDRWEIDDGGALVLNGSDDAFIRARAAAAEARETPQ